MAKFEPFIESARRIVLTSGYAVVLAISAVIALHVLSWSISRCLRLRSTPDIHPGTLCYATSSDIIGSSTIGNHSTGHNAIPLDSSVQTYLARHGNLNDVIMNEENPGEGDNVINIDVMHDVTMTSSYNTLRSNENIDFKYSETNV